MKKILTLLAGTFVTGAMCLAALAEGTPKIQFDQTLYDVGKTSQVTTVSGIFKFKNAGDAVLKLEPPKPSCGCTVAALKSDTLAPGETGELSFTLNLGLYKATMEKHISVKSNDPKTPDVSLTIRADYTPMYEVNPPTMSPNVPFGTNEATQVTTVTRTDGKPLRIERLDSSKPWVTATAEPDKTNESSARIHITVHREGIPRRFNEYVHIYVAGQTNSPASSIYLYGEMMGEVSLVPEALYWSITDATKPPAQAGEELTRRVMIKSATGGGMELKNPQSTIKGLKVELTTKEPGKSYELVARLDEIPAGTISGNVSFETSVAAQSKIEVPVIVNVFKQNN